jgi:Tripartite tricarboxylate transporter family receptor
MGGDQEARRQRPFAAGGPTDVLGRVIAQRMSEIMGQQVMVENVGGADGMTGSKRVADAGVGAVKAGIAEAGPKGGPRMIAVSCSKCGKSLLRYGGKRASKRAIWRLPCHTGMSNHRMSPSKSELAHRDIGRARPQQDFPRTPGTSSHLSSQFANSCTQISSLNMHPGRSA